MVIPVYVLYGMTENTAAATLNYTDHNKIGSVGPPIDETEVKIGENGEILIKGNHVMRGYYKNEEATKETIIDNWLHTGDVGEIDAEGYLKITGRVKDIFKTTKGEYISPSTIEMKLSEDNNIEQVCIVGRGLTQPIAFITLSLQAEKQ